MRNIVLFGAPGSGKGTQAKLLQKRFGFIHLSTGDVCRAEIKKESPEGLHAKKLIDAGFFFPDQLAYQIVKKFIDANKTAQGFIYDGIPRHIGQVPEFENILNERNAKVDLAIELKADENELVKRLLTRGETSGRPDDFEQEIIEKRLQIYHETTAPIAKAYQKAGIYFSINGMGSVNKIFLDIVSLIDTKLCVKPI